MTHLFIQVARAVSAASLAVVATGAQAIEEPAFTVVQKTDVFEVRKYEPYLVAEVVVPGPASEAGNQGFSLLGGYIFGKNKGARKLDMTAPVIQTPAPVIQTPAPGIQTPASGTQSPATPPSSAADAVKLDMTAPVTQAAAPGGFVVQFVMPKGYTLATLPLPLDERVKLREVPARRVAVIRYAGSWSQAVYNEQLELLKNALANVSIATQGEPVLSRYNSPFSLPFLRRNEIWLNLL